MGDRKTVKKCGVQGEDTIESQSRRGGVMGKRSGGTLCSGDTVGLRRDDAMKAWGWRPLTSLEVGREPQRTPVPHTGIRWGPRSVLDAGGRPAR